MIKTRIAPSPTGFPHIGTVYQAMFDYAYARKHGGHFVVRIEDTDAARTVEGAQEKIFQSLDWFGLVEDESPRVGGPCAPYKQSERLEIYKKYALELLTAGNAYICTKTPDELEAYRKIKRDQKLPPIINEFLREQNHTLESVAGQRYVIRMKVPAGRKIKFTDGVRGEIEFDSDLVDDQVLLKSDGFPTYHLAVVVDDHLMGITHILRGEEWINSTPKHILLYEFFGWEKPVYYHTSLLRNPDKTKMSKRHGHASVDWYRENGYLPAAILNYLGTMAWTHPQGTEIFDMQEFVQVFELQDLRAVGPLFDLKKLDWYNGTYIRAMQDASLEQLILSYLKSYQTHQYETVSKNLDLFKKSIPLIKERVKTLAEYYKMCEFYFVPPTQYETDIASKKYLLAATHKALNSGADWSAMAIGEVMQNVAAELGVKNSEYFATMRVAITGCKVSPPLNESMELLGKGEVLARLAKI